MNNDHMKSHLQPHEDKYDQTICDFIANVIDMIDGAYSHNAGMELRIYPEDVKKLREAFKIKGLL